MKKTVLALLLAAASSSSYADMLLGGDVELNAWQQSNTYSNSGDGDSVGLTMEASIEHPIPLIPNPKVAQSSVKADSFEYTKQDFTLYYEFLDNDLVSLDAGVGLTNLTSGKIGSQSFSGYLPHVYAAAEIGIPATPFFVYLKGNGISYDDHQMTDISAGVKYEIGLGLFDVQLQGGYRVQKFDLKDFDSVNLNTKVQGVFAGVNLDF